MGRENMRKFEKFMSDKDRMLKQVKEDAEKDFKVNILKNALLISITKIAFHKISAGCF